MTPLSGFPPKIIQGWYGKALPFWSPDGRYLAVQVPATHAKNGIEEETRDRVLALYDATGAGTRVIDGPEGLGLHWLTADTLRVLDPPEPASVDEESSATCTIWGIRAESGEANNEGMLTWTSEWRLVRPASCNRVALLENPVEEHLGLLPLDSGRLIPLPGRWERANRRYAWSPDSARVGYVAKNELGMEEFYVAGVAGFVARLPANPHEEPKEIYLSPDGKRAAVLSWVQGKGVVHRLLGCGVLKVWEVDTGRVTVIERLSMLSALLTSMRGGEARPPVCWTPDSRSFVYFVVRMPLRIRIYLAHYADWIEANPIRED